MPYNIWWKTICWGYFLKTIFGVINSPNITSNKKFGIGNIKLKDFLKIIRNGISKKRFLFPILPYLNFCKIKKKDIKNIFLFLKKIKNEKIINKKNRLKFPIKYKKLIIFWRILFLKKKKINKNKNKSNIKRGKYISKTLSHCDMYHTKTNKLGQKNKIFKYKENSKIDKWKSSEINNNNNGIKNIKIKNIYKILKEGISKNKNINSIMIEVINNSIQYLSKIDVLSISKYIKNKINNKKIINKKKIIKKFKKGKKIYKKSCKKCHGKINLGNFPIYPKIMKTNKNIKNLKNILEETEVINTMKNRYSSIMPNFKNINKKIKIYVKIVKNLLK